MNYRNWNDRWIIRLIMFVMLHACSSANTALHDLDVGRLSHSVVLLQTDGLEVQNMASSIILYTNHQSIKLTARDGGNRVEGTCHPLANRPDEFELL
jgi:hypothetical protein